MRLSRYIRYSALISDITKTEPNVQSVRHELYLQPHTYAPPSALITTSFTSAFSIAAFKPLYSSSSNIFFS
jgi:hypothetical protein